uniref:Aquaporin 7 n=1 Tax=Gorilla gorilla gorilla TaxID=9595 RepID=A0A2I2Y2X1_GORGO
MCKDGLARGVEGLVSASGSTRGSKMVSWSVIAKIQEILQRKMVREFLAEFMSTYVMMVFGLGSVAHMVLNKKYGSYLGVNLGFGFGVTMGVHVAGRISGAHMNAAVTFANCALGRVPWRKFPVYVLGQFLGSFLAAATIYSLFYTAILHFSGPWVGGVSWGSLGMTPLLNLSWPEVDEGAVLGISPLSRPLPLACSNGENWWWVPVVAPLLGAYLGGIIYLVFIGSTIPREPLKLEDSVAYEDHGITVLPKMGSHEPTISPLTPVSVSPANRSSVHPAPPLHESMALEHF